MDLSCEVQEDKGKNNVKRRYTTMNMQMIKELQHEQGEADSSSNSDPLKSMSDSQTPSGTPMDMTD